VSKTVIFISFSQDQKAVALHILSLF